MKPLQQNDILVNGVNCSYKRNSYRLIERICERSQKQPIFENSKLINWDAIAAEWFLYSHYSHEENEDPDVCLCGKDPIFELCYLQNKHTKIKVLVGNCCVKKFMNIPEMDVVDDYKKIIKDETKTLKQISLRYAWINDFVSFEDCEFYSEFLKPNGLFKGKKSEKHFSKLKTEVQSYKRRINKSFLNGYNYLMNHHWNMMSDVSTLEGRGMFSKLYFNEQN